MASGIPISNGTLYPQIAYTSLSSMRSGVAVNPNMNFGRK